MEEPLKGKLIASDSLQTDKSQLFYWGDSLSSSSLFDKIQFCDKSSPFFFFAFFHDCSFASLTGTKGNHSISPMWWSEVNMRDAGAALVIIIINFATVFTQWNPSQRGTPRSIQFSRVAHRFSPNLHMTTIWQRLENQSYCLVDKKKKIR